MEYACPNCGSKSYMYHYSETTCLGWIPTYEDGKLVNCDPNETTAHLTCSKCKHNFRAVTKQGKVIKVYDDGLPPEIPTFNSSITVNSSKEYKPIDAQTAIATIDTHGQVYRETYSWENEIKELKLKFADLEKQVDKLTKVTKGILKVLENAYS